MKACFQIVERSKCLKRIFFQDLTEAMPKGISIEQFCSCNKAPYNIFYKWFIESVNRMQFSSFEFLNVKTLSNVFNGCRFFPASDLANFRSNECRVKLV